MSRRVLAVAVAVAVLLASAALAVRALASRSGPADPRTVVRLRVSVEQWRTDEVARTVEIAMRNDGPVPVRVERVELLAPSFTGHGPVQVDAPLPAGGLRVDVVVPYGTGRCAGDEPDPASAPSSVALRVRTGDGVVRDVRVPLAHPNAMLDKLLGQDCQQERLNRVVRIAFGPWAVDPDGSLRGTVVLDRTGPATPVTLHEVTGNILYSLRPVPPDRQRPLAVAAPEQDTLAVPVLAAIDRCSAHVLGEIKKPYVFPAFVSVADGPKLYTEITTTEVDRAALDALARRQCRPDGSD